MAGVFGALLISSTAFILIDMQLSRKSIEKEQRIRASIIGQNVATALLFGDAGAAREDMAALKIDPYLLQVRLLRDDGSVFVRLPDQPVVPEGPVFQIREEISQDGELIGYIEMDSSFGAFYARLRSYLQIVIIILAATILLSFPLTLILQRFVSTPILRLAAAVHNISQTRNFTRKVDPIEGRELGILTGGINEMLVQIVLREQELCAEINERRIAEKKLQASEKNLATTLNAMTEAVVATDVKGTIQWFNHVAEELLGFPSGEIIGQPFKSFVALPDDSLNLFREDPSRIGAGQTNFPSVQTLALYAGEKRLEIQYSTAPIYNEEKNVTGYVFVFRDITEQKRLEEHLRQAKKMDAVGQLAGGIAHDFNNILTGIMGSAELLRESIPQTERTAEFIDMIIKMVSRAADLTRKLLAFSRDDKAAAETMDVREAVNDAISILRHTIDPRISLKTNLPDDPLYIKGNSSQIQNVFLNLGLNARDAMPDGGTLEYSAQSVYLDSLYCQQHPDLERPGYYVEINVTDTGCGMSREVQERVFEPFFTTKERGKGTGLGLATVYGIVKDNGGSIFLYSEENKGTTFKIFLPRQQAADGGSGQGNAAPMPGTERLLLADDEAAIRRFAAQALQTLGYDVVTAENGEEALQILHNDPQGFDLIILDIMMPVKNGEETLDEIRETHPDIPVIIATGFAPASTVQHLTAKGAACIVQKPFKIADLSVAIRQTLPASAQGA